ncbi:uncharacterized protein BCR38DRAFT_329289 [Pseudomassariella vexata]|uniref:DUF6604 domain-containing protein n=1 Tax=Pseudomassariella vexata TaxID=1141098 RepID=A0A1Y2EJV5_9PEZI|nr:uncharacterized protein BCR38DRAFT_329289 [Pseudomassariella vexata]ORY71843.1 hypothetical protein BCR38DRAFT_329289 [Pseudomassariella vexata]
MQPDELGTVYKQYKADTNYLAGWLASTARAHGYGRKSQSSKPHVNKNHKKHKKHKKRKGRSKGRALPEVNMAEETQAPSKEHIIDVKDFVPLAEYVVAINTKPAVSVPETIVIVTRRVIKVRKDFGSQLRERGYKLDEDSDRRHAHFVTILEDVLRILRLKVASRQQAKVNTSSDTNQAGGNPIEGFVHLSVDEPSQEFLDAPDFVHPEIVHENGSKYEAKLQSTRDEALFALQTVMADVDEIRRFVLFEWTKIASSQSPTSQSISVASIMTDTAIGIARHLVEEIDPLLEEHGGWLELLKELYVCESRQSLQDDSFSPFAGRENRGIILCFPECERTLILAWDILKAHRNGFARKDVYIINNNVLEHPEWQTGAEDFEVAYDLVGSFMLGLKRIALNGRKWPLVIDEFVRGLVEIFRTREIPFFSLLATQLFIDINRTMGSKFSVPFDNMIRETGVIRDTIEQYLEFQQSRPWAGLSNQAEASLHKLRKDLQELASMGSDETPNPNPVSNASTPGFHLLLRSSPVLCGLLSSTAHVLMHQIGFHIAELGGMVTLAVHLYNAVRQEGLLKAPWVDLDTCINLLQYPSLFVGGEPPKDPNTYFQRLLLQVGVSASEFSRGARKFEDMELSSKGTRRWHPVAPIHQVFRNRYTRNDQPRWTAEYIKTVIDHDHWTAPKDLGINAKRTASQEIPGMVCRMSAATFREKQKLIKRQKRNKEKAEPLPLTTLLEMLERTLYFEKIEACFSYLKMHQQAWTLLENFKRACDPWVAQIPRLNYGAEELDFLFPVLALLRHIRAPGCHAMLVANVINEFNASPESSKARQYLLDSLGIYGRLEYGPQVGRGAFQVILTIEQRIPEVSDADGERWRRWWDTGVYSPKTT